VSELALYEGERVRRLERGHDAFELGEGVKRRDRLVVGDAVISDAAFVFQKTVLRSHTGIIEPGRDGVRGAHLPVLVLQKIAVRAVQHAGASARECGGVSLVRTARLDTMKMDVAIF
jgi:hypothetical protein